MLPKSFLINLSHIDCVEAQIHASQNVMEFLKDSTRETLGSVMYVDADPVALGEKMVEDIKAKRKALGWD